jgi:TRAP-type mannitol/chloroaromatic compound transport system permease small subunit
MLKALHAVDRLSILVGKLFGWLILAMVAIIV